MKPQHVLNYARTHRKRFVEELKQFVSFPSVTAQPKYANDRRRCAAWLAAHLRRIGLPTVHVFGQEHPIVYASSSFLARRPTLLIYGHYDVQPADPLHEWHSPPFSAVVHGEHLYGRGSCDDKGQLFAHIKALECYMRAVQSVPVNVKCLFEGEEESGSSTLIDFVLRNRRVLAANVAVISDTAIPGPEKPAITHSLRGSLSFELEVLGPKQDLHSGTFGGAICNPLQVLSEIIAQLHGADGCIAIPGFYDHVREWTDAEREYMQRTGPDDAQILKDAAVTELTGESGFTAYERTTIRPALTINGIAGGYQGCGGKAIIPSRATAKINLRIVPDQQPDEVEHLFRQYVARLEPAGIKIIVRKLSSAKPALTDRNHPVSRAAVIAYRNAFGRVPVFLRSGGTIPGVNLFQETLGVPTVLMGFGLPDAQIHAPNERLHLPTFFNGIAASIWFMSAVARDCCFLKAQKMAETSEARP